MALKISKATLQALHGRRAANQKSAQLFDARRGPTRDYSDRSGLPKPPEQMRGAAREEVALKGQVPRDLRSPRAA